MKIFQIEKEQKKKKILALLLWEEAVGGLGAAVNPCVPAIFQTTT